MIEKFCNGNRFDYDIEIDPAIEMDYIKIPPMLLQPFVENSIKHGLRYLKERKGNIHVSFKEVGNYIECTVVDNGIGRKQADVMNKQGKETYHTSTALKVIQERLDLLNGNEEVNPIQIIDLYDEKNEAIPFASVFVAGSTMGTTSNENGFYLLVLKPGKYVITVKSIGFTTLSKEIVVTDEEQELNFKLKEETIKIKEFTVNSDAEDPAYAVIRNAINKRKFYKEQVEAFSCDVYIKGVQKLQKKPNRVMGLKVSMNASWDTATGIIYMSESVSKYNFKQPNKIKEEMISSLVSGNNQAFSYNQASDMFFNFYENVMDVISLGARGFISPISSNAMLTYRYKLLGTFYDQGQLVNKIQVIPKRKNDPAFAGIIYIMEDSWRIYSTHLYLTKDAQIDFVDTLHIDQVYLPVSADVWMPFSNNYTFTFDVLGFKGGGNYVSMNSNYQLNPNFPDHFFTNNLLEIKEGANKKDTAYWNKYRPVPLTDVEKRDYVWRDSITSIKESKPYKDSVDRVNNKFKIGNLLRGYEYRNSFKKRSLRINSPSTTLLYNTVQGLTLGTKITYAQELENRKRQTNWGKLSR